MKVAYVEKIEKKKKAEVNKKKKQKKIIEKKTVKEEKKEKEIKPKKNKNEKLLKKKNEKKLEKKVLEKKINKKKFDDLLKNLAEKDLDNSREVIEIEDINKTINKLAESEIDENLSNKTPFGELLIIQNLLLEQIDSNWSRPPGIKASDTISIKIIISLNIQGEVINLRVSDKTLKELKKNLALQPYLDSAVRAIKKSSPFEGLRKDRYNIWREVIINFKPRETR